MSTGICHLCTKPGQCCTYVELPVVQFGYVKPDGYDSMSDVAFADRIPAFRTARPLSSDEQKWITLHVGLQMDSDSDVRVDLEALPQRNVHMRTLTRTVHIDTPCKALVPETGFCGLYGSDERPQMCADWPDDPANQAPEGCAYLNPEHRALIQAEGSPLPS